MQQLGEAERVGRREPHLDRLATGVGHLEVHLAALEPDGDRVAGVTLVESRLHPQGARYEVLEEVALRPAVRFEP